MHGRKVSLKFGSYDRPSDRDNAGSMNSQEWWINKVAVSSSDNGKSAG